MPRATSAVAKHRRIKRLLKHTKGYWGTRKNQNRHAKETYRRALRFAFRDRKNRKRVFRSLWITRISAAVAPYGFSYSTFIGSLRRAKVTLDRKALSEMAIHDAKGFEHIIDAARQNLPEHLRAKKNPA